MRILVVSDIHSNLAALNAVFKDAGEFDQIWCLGDMVGYGPDPNECVERLRAYDAVCLAGNHDLAVVGKANLADFNSDAREAIAWSRFRLTLDNRDWLATLPTKTELPEHGITLVHGSPIDPVWEYIFTPPVARANFDAIAAPICLNGHTHVPLIFRKPTYEHDIMMSRPPNGVPIALKTDDRWLINPGSVGQPRDDDSRAAYGLIDLDAMTFTQRRVQYDIAATQDKIKQAKLPGNLSRRLRFGQ